MTACLNVCLGFPIAVVCERTAGCRFLFENMNGLCSSFWRIWEEDRLTMLVPSGEIFRTVFHCASNENCSRIRQAIIYWTISMNQSRSFTVTEQYPHTIIQFFSWNGRLTDTSTMNVEVFLLTGVRFRSADVCDAQFSFTSLSLVRFSVTIPRYSIHRGPIWQI